MKDLHVVMSDATCYESLLRYPTNKKLLWESIEWTYGRIVNLCKGLKVRRPRSKYDEIRKRYLNFSRETGTKTAETTKESSLRIYRQKIKMGVDLFTTSTSHTLKNGIISSFSL